MARKNDEITSEEDAHVESGSQPADQAPAPAADLPKAFPFPGDTQTQGTRNPDGQYLSSSMANELAMYGSTINPATGVRVTRDDFPGRFDESGQLVGGSQAPAE